jgi:hypothetical protein
MGIAEMHARLEAGLIDSFSAANAVSAVQPAKSKSDEQKPSAAFGIEIKALFG